MDANSAINFATRTEQVSERLPGEMERLGIEKLSDIIGCIE